ncbi:FAD-dependent monooxygenase [Comamonas sp. CMM02]|jgi:salicylate hydroxylase|uniref:FAD-dependent monooxygenase n=1 Tax=Comamonas sp. CMM02 TaxID=2769307 RepID=UPI00178288EE|nr:FAD-dependent monooxygenase [Comamonas sp. CMM02]MBD9401053.1 FAD-dependent monooxygenase [Comamonas sp. CMM02]
MRKQVLIAGGGIAGMAAALGASHAGWDARLFERSPQFSEVGAGVQLGPNVVRRLQAWGLQKALQQVVALPQQLVARSGINGKVLASAPLGQSMVERYGAAYVTIHRADLHGVLHQAAQQRADIFINPGQEVSELLGAERVTTIRTSANKVVEGDALMLADGVWSKLRGPLLGDSSRPRVSGHLAYRALLPMADVPVGWRSNEVTVWLGPRMHAVHYPVRRGEMMNIVVIIEGPAPQDMEHWDHAANAQALEQALKHCSSNLQDLVRSVPAAGGQWRLWPLSDRAPLQGPEGMARGLVGLIGDAAHPMRPYLAQGAGMAIEDAAELQRALAMDDLEVELRLRRYAINRWERNARVQARSIRNGNIFHATGPVRWGRDLTMRMLGSQLMDLPWLYRGDGSSASSL